MKSAHTLLAFCTVAMLAFCAASASAQNIYIYGGNNGEIIDGSVSTSQLNRTDMGKVQVNGGTSEFDYYVGNSDENVDLTIQANVSITGPHAADFFVVYQSYSTIENGTESPFRIRFNPSAPGVRNATVTLLNNTPGAEGTFTFAITGEGLTGLPLATADLTFGFKANAKVSFNKSAGLYKVKWSFPVMNEGPVATEGALVKVYRSENSGFSADQDGPPLAEILVKDLPAAVPGKPLKKKMVKFKGEFPQFSGYLFAVVTPIPLFPSESDQSDNLTGNSYYYVAK